MSQKSLADRLGVSSQLAQKYEAGLVRLGSGRLRQVATVLGVNVTFFFAGLDSVTRGSIDKARVINLADSPEGMRLFHARVRCGRVRRRLLSLIESAVEA